MSLVALCQYAARNCASVCHVKTQLRSGYRAQSPHDEHPTLAASLGLSSPRRVCAPMQPTWNAKILTNNCYSRKKPEKETKTKSPAGTATTTTVQIMQTQITPTSGTTTTQRKLSGHWIDFENIPEKRKPPKRITALPKDGVISTTTSSSRTHAAQTSGQHAAHTHAHGQGPGHGHQPPQPDVTMDGKIHYNYVKPEDCQCECHEAKREGAVGAGADETEEAGTVGADDEADGVASSKSITSVDLLQQGEDMLPLLDPDTQDGIEPSDSSREYSCYTDDEMDVPMRQTSSSRSKSSSSKLDEFPRRDVSHSPRNRKFPDNRK
ncbi:uncharacterized protein LOC118732794 [Rhagoletis pomonella]|uniref:uncharacterized protein LOC118732794 n=1 Tax=Rhagoletis pomonella TaxID=28610 RepID=UPI00177DA4B0|nr:uncharacterized protein LOC118732794 [Rhagoletis pomonella]